MEMNEFKQYMNDLPNEMLIFALETAMQSWGANIEYNKGKLVYRERYSNKVFDISNIFLDNFEKTQNDKMNGFDELFNQAKHDIFIKASHDEISVEEVLHQIEIESKQLSKNKQPYKDILQVYNNLQNDIRAIVNGGVVEVYDGCKLVFDKFDKEKFNGGIPYFVQRVYTRGVVASGYQSYVAMPGCVIVARSNKPVKCITGIDDLSIHNMYIEDNVSGR